MSTNGDFPLARSESQAESQASAAVEAASRFARERWTPPSSSNTVDQSKRSERGEPKESAPASDRKERDKAEKVPRTGEVILLDAINAGNKAKRDEYIKEFKDMREAAFKRGTLDAFDSTTLFAMARNGYRYGISTLKIGETRGDTIQLRNNKDLKLLFEFNQSLEKTEK